jgi:hypothetical protein
MKRAVGRGYEGAPPGIGVPEGGPEVNDDLIDVVAVVAAIVLVTLIALAC